MQASRVSQRQLADALGRWPSEVARWCLESSMPTTVLVEIGLVMPRLFLAYVDLAAEVPEPVPSGGDATGAALDVSAKTGQLCGLVRARASAVEVDRGANEVMVATRRLRAACRAGGSR